MNFIAKIVAISAFAAGAAALATSAPSQAQVPRAVGRPIVIQPQPASKCCMPARQSIVSNATWSLTPPTGPTIAAVVSAPNVGYAPALPGSQWIGPSANSGNDWSAAGGVYKYSIHICLCTAPAGVPLPVAAQLSVLADNGFKAKLNNNAIPGAANAGPYAFHNPATTFSIPASMFQPGDNVLTIEVSNDPSSPTALDVSGWIAGYFQEIPYGQHCPSYSSYPPNQSPR